MYRDLVESQQDLIVKFSPEGRLLYVNPAYCEAVGKTKEALADSVFMPVTSERYSDVIATQMTKLFKPPFACVVEQWIQTQKGMRCFSWAAKSVLDDTKSVVAIVASGRDITRAKHEIKALRRKDEELMLVVENGKPMFYSHTLEHQMVFVSPRIRTLLGCRPRTGKWVWTDYLTDNPLNAAGLERTIRAISSGKREPPYRLEMSVSGGGTIWFEVNEIPVVKNGKTVSIVGSMIDVTEKMYVEDGLAEAEVLMKVSADRRKEAAAESGKSPFGFIKSIFTKEKDGGNGE
jgi:PAS domain S-box-containing protein